MLDTNVAVSGLLWRGAPRELLQLGFNGDVQFFTSTPLLAELTDILSRPKFRLKIAASQLSIDEIVDLYAQLAAVVSPAPVPRLARDQDDDVVIATAVAAHAELIVTGDLGLLQVVEYTGIRIVSVSEALRIVASG